MDDIRRAEELVANLRRIIRAVGVHSRKLVQRYGLTAPQLMILQVLAKADNLSVGKLAAKVNLSPATVTGIVDRLEHRNLVKRERNQGDKRRVMVRIQPKGQEVLSKAPLLPEGKFVKRFNALEQWEQTMMLSSLQRIAAMMDAEGEDDAPGPAGAGLFVDEQSGAPGGVLDPGEREKYRRPE